jgi:hypothetical protein
MVVPYSVVPERITPAWGKLPSVPSKFPNVVIPLNIMRDSNASMALGMAWRKPRDRDFARHATMRANKTTARFKAGNFTDIAHFSQKLKKTAAQRIAGDNLRSYKKLEPGR